MGLLGPYSPDSVILPVVGATAGGQGQKDHTTGWMQQFCMFAPFVASCPAHGKDKLGHGNCSSLPSTANEKVDMHSQSEEWQVAWFFVICGNLTRSEHVHSPYSIRTTRKPKGHWFQSMHFGIRALLHFYSAERF